MHLYPTSPPANPLNASDEIILLKPSIHLPRAGLIPPADEASGNNSGAVGAVEIEGREAKLDYPGARVSLDGLLPLPFAWINLCLAD
jgi:hypothetical protein